MNVIGDESTGASLYYQLVQTTGDTLSAALNPLVPVVLIFTSNSFGTMLIVVLQSFVVYLNHYATAISAFILNSWYNQNSVGITLSIHTNVLPIKSARQKQLANTTSSL